jgi:hypothetical protein
MSLGKSRSPLLFVLSLSLSLLFVSTCVYLGEAVVESPDPHSHLRVGWGFIYISEEASSGGRGRFTSIYSSEVLQREGTTSGGGESQNDACWQRHGANSLAGWWAPCPGRTHLGSFFTTDSEASGGPARSWPTAADNPLRRLPVLWSWPWSRLREQRRALKHAQALTSRPGEQRGAPAERILGSKAVQRGLIGIRSEAATSTSTGFEKDCQGGGDPRLRRASIPGRMVVAGRVIFWLHATNCRCLYLQVHSDPYHHATAAAKKGVRGGAPAPGGQKFRWNFPPLFFTVRMQTPNNWTSAPIPARLRTTSGALVEDPGGHDPESSFVHSTHARAPSRPGTNGGANMERVMGPHHAKILGATPVFLCGQRHGGHKRQGLELAQAIWPHCLPCKIAPAVVTGHVASWGEFRILQATLFLWRAISGGLKWVTFGGFQPMVFYHFFFAD